VRIKGGLCIVKNRFYSFALFFLVLLLGYLTYKILNPFLSSIAWAIVLSIVFYPVYAFLLKYLKWSPITSFVTLLIIIVAIFGPFSYLSYLLKQEADALIEYAKAGQFDTIEKLLTHPTISRLLESVSSMFNMTIKELMDVVLGAISFAGKESAGIIKTGLGNVASAVFDFVFMFLSIFFLLEDGPKFLNKLSGYMPFNQNEKEKLIKQVKDIIISTIYGGVIVAIFQGAIGGITFYALGIHSPVLWGLAMFITSFVPMLGTFIIWGPAAAYLFFNGFYIKAFVLIFVGVFVISMVDNVLRPIIIKGKMKMPILAIFFSILGGIKLFGLIGFIMGPLVLALFISVVEIWRYTEEEQARKQEGSG